ncbi:MAG: N-acetyl-gamma-glutamyl-phosphate reductase [Actinomycetota bacterium]|nr:N-acetyl-gamma-glutamyl-phosphate reductase [Actinomycetota bacterium]
MGVRVAVAGASGSAGGELLRLLATHPGVELAALAGYATAGRSVAAVHPQLPALAARTLLSPDPIVLGEADLVFLALPPGRSGQLAGSLPTTVKVVDLGADHRLADPADWARWYTGPYAGHWPYGLPELPGARARIAGAGRVAVPGCYPTAVVLGLAPLLAAGLVEPSDIVVVAASGFSGAGRKRGPGAGAGGLAAYGVGGGHRHVPEIVQVLGAAAGARVRLSFTPVLAPMPQGILAICTARLSGRGGEPALRDALATAYHAEPLVHLLPVGSWPQTAATTGAAAAHLQVSADPAAGRAVVVVALDNLGKGAAGQAVQCANLMLGLPETAGLSSAGVTP